jgi:hypothetical protein
MYSRAKTYSQLPLESVGGAKENLGRLQHHTSEFSLYIQKLGSILWTSNLVAQRGGEIEGMWTAYCTEVIVILNGMYVAVGGRRLTKSMITLYEPIKMRNPNKRSSGHLYIYQTILNSLS